MLKDPWLESWDWDNLLKKKTQFNHGSNAKTDNIDHDTKIFIYKTNYEAQFPIDLVFNNKIGKKIN